MKAVDAEPVTLVEGLGTLRTGGLCLSDEDMANLRYLAHHRIPEILERLAKGLMRDQPPDPVAYLVQQLAEPKATATATAPARVTRIEEFAKVSAGPPTLKLGSDAGRAVGRRAPLEKEDSVHSEASTFSVNSVDMAEFLSELRQAYAHVVRDPLRRLTKAQLADIIDYVAIPVPDGVLDEVFGELDPGPGGAVELDAFLARMGYRIQNRFSADLLKSYFLTAAADNNVLDAAGVHALLRKLGFRISEADTRDLCARHTVLKSLVTVEEFQRLAGVHAAAFAPAPLPVRSVPSLPSRIPPHS